MNQKRLFSMSLLGFARLWVLGLSLLVFVFASIACSDTIPETKNPTPVKGDFIISGLTQNYNGRPKEVTITPKEGKSPGEITIYYNRKTVRPSAVGHYKVTFDVTKAAGWNEAVGLSAGTMNIEPVDPNKQTPVADDYDVDNLSQTAGSVTAVTITAKTDKSSGTITIFYNGDLDIPQTAGSYPVTFNVAAAPGWNAEYDLSAGTLTVTGGDNPGPNPNPNPNPNPTGPLPYDPTIPQRPGDGVNKKMYFQFNNRTNGAYSDSQIYITIIGKDLDDPTRQWKYVNSSGNFVTVKGTALDGNPYPAGPKHTTTMAFKISDGANSTNGTKYVYMPNIESGRMFISYGQPLSIGWVYGADNLLGFAGPDVNNPGDLNYNIHFEFLEFTIEPTPNGLVGGTENRYYGNTTRVDFFDFPMVTTLHSIRGSDTVGEIGTRDSIRNAWQNGVPAAFKPLMNNMRIMAPAKGANRVSDTYFDGYVNELWTTWRNAEANNVVFNCGDAGTIRGTMGGDDVLRMVRDGHVGHPAWGDIIIRKPTTDDVFEGKGNFARAEGSVDGTLAVQAQLCAAINRGVAHLNAWNDESQYYNSWTTSGKPVNYYAKFWHEHSIDRYAYGFCYDDVFDWATLLVGENPIALVMDLKWN